MTLRNSAYLIERLLCRESYYGILTVELLLGQSLHAYPHTLLRSQGYHAETFGLTVATVLEELYFHEVVHPDTLNRVRYVLIARPLKIRLFVLSDKTNGKMN